MVQKKEYLVKEIQQLVDWIELECVDPEGNPLANVEYILYLPDGNERTGTLDEKGYAKIENISKGECELLVLGHESVLKYSEG